MRMTKTWTKIGLVPVLLMLVCPLACQKSNPETAEKDLPTSAEPDNKAVPPVSGWIELVNVPGMIPPKDRILVTTEGGSRVDIMTWKFRQPPKVEKTFLAPCRGSEVAWLLRVIEAAAGKPKPELPVDRGRTIFRIRCKSGEQVNTVALDRYPGGVWNGIMDELACVAHLELAQALTEQSRAESLAKEGDNKQACDKYKNALESFWRWEWGRLSPTASTRMTWEPELALIEPMDKVEKENYGEALWLFRKMWEDGRAFSSKEEDGAVVIGFGFGSVTAGLPDALTPELVQRLKNWQFGE